MRFYVLILAGLIFALASLTSTLSLAQTPTDTPAPDQSLLSAPDSSILSKPQPEKPASLPPPQTKTQATPTPNTSVPDKMSDLPDKYIHEMEGFFAYCKNDDYLKAHFDCRCLSVQYIDKRTQQGPSANSSDIIKAMEKKSCRYEPENLTDRKYLGEDLSEIPDEYIEEAHKFYENCNATYQMSMNYDCECLSTRFLDNRVEREEEVSADEILMYISTECPNTAGAAAHIYNACLTQGPLLPPNQKVEDFCECTANTFAKIYKDAGISAGSQQYTSLRSSAMLMCTKNRNGDPIYPNITKRR
ncbi:MAG: hypothetical protein DHS20C02_17470 [Micavibrio sp.]|nr:MAG: hypothetical protein DHS20C02_17470 [Micavibrio sp.]